MAGGNSRERASVRCGAVDKSSCRCLFVGRSWCAGYGGELHKEGGQPDETRLDQSGIAFCSAGEEVLLGVLFVLFCEWVEGISVEDVSGWRLRILRMCLSSAACVSEQLPVTVFGRSGVVVCSVRRADELTTHDRAHGAEAMDGRAEARRERLSTEADTHSHSHRRHARLAAAKDYGARRPDDLDA
jgi:hypothetical protein